MMGLWADGWFYISSAGLLVSGILFFFLLGQYRVASEAADVHEGESGADKEVSAPAVVRPVYTPDESASARVASHIEKAEPKTEPKPEPAPAPAPAPTAKPKLDPANTTGQISPAVVYLQNIKVELADLHKDLRSLAKRVDDELASVSTRDEALIERLGELTRAVEGIKAAAAAQPAEAAPAPEPAPAPKRARKEKTPDPVPEPAPEPAPEPIVEPPPAPQSVAVIEMPAPLVLETPKAAEPAPLTLEPQPEPKKKQFSPDETIRMDLSAIIAPERVPEPAPVAEPAPEVKPEPIVEAPPVEKPRRGPVWPV